MISLAHPTLPSLSPPELIRVAASTGFDAVGFRIARLGPHPEMSSIFRDESLLRATSEVLKASGIRVLDVEVIGIEPDTRAANYRFLFEAGARLGAQYVVAISMDGDEARVTEHYAELCAEAANYGLTVVLEFMILGQIRTLDAAYRIVTAAGRGGVLVDALHFYRSGARAAALAPLDPALFPYMQINDVEHFDALRDAPNPKDVVWKKVMPGLGDLPLRELLQALPAGIPIAVEAHSGEGIVGPTAEARARQAIETTRAVLACVLETRRA